jgi:hypothetical protein
MPLVGADLADVDHLARHADHVAEALAQLAASLV